MVATATSTKIVSLDIESFTQDVRTAKASVQVLVDRRQRILAEIEELGMLGKQDRMAKAADLIERLNSSISVYKGFKAQVNLVQKDLETTQEALEAAVLKELGTADVYVASDGWVIKKKLNPQVVDVKEEADVEKKWRNKPAAHPPWQKWSLDKKKILKALKEGKEVIGCGIARGVKLVIERRI